MHTNTYVMEIPTIQLTKTTVFTIPLGNCSNNFSKGQLAHWSVSPILIALTLKLLGTSDPYAMDFSGSLHLCHSCSICSLWSAQLVSSCSLL